MPTSSPQTTQTYAFSGYASLYNVRDQQNDVVLPRAFSASLQRWQSDGRLPSLLWQHDTARPIGKIIQIIDNNKGLFIKGVLLLSVQQGLEAGALVEQRALDGLSVGYHAIKTARDPKTGSRLIQEATLWEVSLVTFPANLKTRIDVL